MNAVFSLWSAPMNGPSAGGWRSLRDHLLSWVLSVETSRPHFAATRLVTDTQGAELLVDRLGLAFDDVSLALDDLAETDAELWAFGKLHAYRAQTEPFLHIDSDVYLWKPPPLAAYAADVFTTYPEHRAYGDACYRPAALKADIRRVGGWIPEELDAYLPTAGVIGAENCAIIGGRRTDFIAAYADAAIRMLEHPRNRHAWKLRRPMNADMLIFEQHMLAAFLQFHAGRAGSPFASVHVTHFFADEYAAFRESAEAGFTHLISRAKEDAALLARLDRRVRRDHPALHARVDDIVGATARAA
jgi:Family of unknown function (DUF6734)